MIHRTIPGEPALPPPPLAVAAVLLYSPAPEELARFYRVKLGVPLERVELQGVEAHWACDINHVYISIWPGEGEQGELPPGRAGMALYVRDVWLTFERLKEEGVEVMAQPTRSAMGLIARLRDPDGNPLELYQPLPAA
mgnify:CR=1 FL=1